MLKRNIIRDVYYGFLLLFMVPAIAQKYAGPDPFKAYTPAQLREDYQVLISTLREAYPSLYRYNTKTHIDQFFTEHLAKLGRPLTEKQFFPIIASTAAAMKDEHVIPTPSPSYYRDVFKGHARFLPFNFKIVNRKMFVYRSIVPALKAGREIISINGVPVMDIIEKLVQYLPRDGYIKTFLYRHLEDYSPTQNENLFDLYHSFFYDLPKKCGLVTRDPDNRLSGMEVSSLTYSEYEEFYKTRNLHEPPFELTSPGKDISYMRISSFHSFYREMHRQDFDTLFEAAFRQLDRNRTPNLIIDLRRCEGGDNSYQLLLSYLMNKPFRVFDYLEVSYTGLPLTSKYFANLDNAFLIDSMLYRTATGMYRLKSQFESTVAGLTEIKPKQHSFKGKLYVLTSGATASAAGIVSSVLKNSKRATFIGEETGGAMEGPTSLNISMLVLPNTGIRVEIPHIRTQLAVSYTKGRGVIPEHAVEPTARDLADETDGVLSFTLNLISNSAAKVLSK